MLSFIIGLVYANLVEWLVHKYILHGWGKKKNSFWSFHWHEHHNTCKKNSFYDASYDEYHFLEGSRKKESLGIILLSLSHLILIAVAPAFVLGTWCYAALYLYLHKISHKYPVWSKKYMPWHWDHHMGKNQDLNWNVVFPLMDWILGTRKKY